MLLRILLGAVLVIHAVQKTAGWLDGAGFSATVGGFEKLGQRPPKLMVAVAAVSETSAGVLLILGLATPIAGVVAAATMLVAGTSQSLALRKVAHWRGGGEYPLVLAGLAYALALTGPSQLSLDNAAGGVGRWSSSLVANDSWPFIAAAVALALATPPIASAAHHIRDRQGMK